MVAFMDESGVNTYNVYSTISEIVRSHLRIIKFLTLIQNLRLLTCKTSNLLIIQQWITTHFNPNLLTLLSTVCSKEEVMPLCAVTFLMSGKYYCVCSRVSDFTGKEYRLNLERNKDEGKEAS